MQWQILGRLMLIAGCAWAALPLSAVEGQSAAPMAQEVREATEVTEVEEGAESAESAEGDEPAQATPALDVATLFALHGQVQAVSGRFRDVVTRLEGGTDDGAAPNVLHVQFWLQQPRSYHFIVHEGDSEDRQHYIGDGEQRWQVEVVLDHPIVDRQAAHADDPFARIQRLMQLDQEALAADFTWDALLDLHADGQRPDPLKTLDLPADWQRGLWLVPHSPAMRSEVHQVLVAFSSAGELRGLIIDDVHGNRRTVHIEELVVHEQLAEDLFRWADAEGVEE